MPSRLFLLFLAMAPFLAACGLETGEPQRTPAPPTPKPPLSRLAVTLDIPAEQLARLFDNMTEYRIADLKDQPVNCGIGRCRLDLLATRRGQVTVKAEDGVLMLHMPFAIRAEMNAPGSFSFLRARGEGEGVADARASLSLTPELALQARTDGRVSLDNGHLRLGPIVANIAQLWNDNQEKLAKPLWKSLDKQISALPLRDRVADLWATGFTPIRVGKAPLSWLVLRPESLDVAEPHIADGKIELALAIAARGQVVVQDKPPENRPVPLPPAGRLAQHLDEFAVAVPVTLAYGRAAELAMASLKRKPPHLAGFRLAFDGLRILPSGQDVVVGAKICADPDWDRWGLLKACGMTWLRGAPRFDPADQTIRIVGLHYDGGGAGLMLRLVRMMMGARLADALQSHLVFNESREIARLKEQVTLALAEPRGRDLVLSAEVKSFGAPFFTWTETGFLANFSVTGKVRAQLPF
ncbi:MAG TPA: DUF4403 family protein [Rhizomicrobium sp.]|jgi:hypothetical protein|nr:DUF4403 family protein [Rhizomicrobium sp.]